MLRVRTDSGSVYDVDHDGKRIRRVHGRLGPSDTKPQDGIWRQFVGLDGPVVGETMVVYWASQDGGSTETNLGFRTTVVLEIEVFEPDDHETASQGHATDAVRGAGWEAAEGGGDKTVPITGDPWREGESAPS